MFNQKIHFGTVTTSYLLYLIPLLLSLSFFAGDCPAPAPTIYTITLNANTGTIGTKTTLTVESGKTATALTGSELPTKANYTLFGWNTKADGKGTAFVFGTTTVTADVTIYAQWTQNIPGVPTGLTATAISTSQINLSWTATANATKYNLFDGTTQIGGDITTTTYSHTGLTASSIHSYTLKACNGAGCSAASSAVSATTKEATVTATEIPKAIPSKYDVLGFNTKVAKRFHYIAFSVSADASLTDYHLALKKSDLNAPTAAEMVSGAKIKRNLSTTSIHLLLHHDLTSTISTDFATPSTTVQTGTKVDDALLKPNTTYALYGMKNGGSTVVKLGQFSTDAFDASATYNGVLQQTFDPILYTYKANSADATRANDITSDYSFSLRIGEPRLFPVIVSVHGNPAKNQYIQGVNYFLESILIENNLVIFIPENFGGLFFQPNAFSGFSFGAASDKNKIDAYYVSLITTDAIQPFKINTSISSGATFQITSSFTYDY